MGCPASASFSMINDPMSFPDRLLSCVHPFPDPLMMEAVVPAIASTLKARSGEGIAAKMAPGSRLLPPVVHISSQGVLVDLLGLNTMVLVSNRVLPYPSPIIVLSALDPFWWQVILDSILTQVSYFLDFS